MSDGNVALLHFWRTWGLDHQKDLPLIDGIVTEAMNHKTADGQPVGSKGGNIDAEAHIDAEKSEREQTDNGYVK